MPKLVSGDNCSEPPTPPKQNKRFFSYLNTPPLSTKKKANKTIEWDGTSKEKSPTIVSNSEIGYSAPILLFQNSVPANGTNNTNDFSLIERESNDDVIVPDSPIDFGTAEDDYDFFANTMESLKPDFPSDPTEIMGKIELDTNGNDSVPKDNIDDSHLEIEDITENLILLPSVKIEIVALNINNNSFSTVEEDIEPIKMKVLFESLEQKTVRKRQFKCFKRKMPFKNRILEMIAQPPYMPSARNTSAIIDPDWKIEEEQVSPYVKTNTVLLEDRSTVEFIDPDFD